MQDARGSTAGLDRGTMNLVSDLLIKPTTEGVRTIIMRALSLHYHDEKSPYRFPEILLMEHLLAEGLFDIIHNAVTGRYDHEDGEVEPAEQAA